MADKNVQVKDADKKKKKKKNQFIYADGKVRKPRWPFIALAAIIIIFCVQNLIGNDFMEMVGFYKEQNAISREEKKAAKEAAENGEEILTETTVKAEKTTERKDSVEDKNPGELKFKKKKDLDEQFLKYGEAVGADTADEYEQMAIKLTKGSKIMQKTESKTGRKVYFNNSTGEIVFVDTNGYLSTYYKTDYKTYKLL